jgi:hypothetical protein
LDDKVNGATIPFCDKHVARGVNGDSSWIAKPRENAHRSVQPDYLDRFMAIVCSENVAHSVDSNSIWKKPRA